MVARHQQTLPADLLPRPPGSLGGEGGTAVWQETPSGSGSPLIRTRCYTTGCAPRIPYSSATTSWHWLDPESRYQKAAQALEPEGTLAIITTHHALPQGGDRFFADVQDDYASIREVDSPPPLPDDVENLVEEIGSSGWFSDVDVRRYVWAQPYTTDEYLSLLDTYSGHRAMEARTRELLYRRIARRIDARAERTSPSTICS
ncbi:MAG: hypothetical protein M3214_04780 [Actinomycetota bacterium]|nr:hypothetical protein [Actinomycetota bacterium]